MNYNKCIIQTINGSYSTAYSYSSGKFYLVDKTFLPISVSQNENATRKKLLLSNSEHDRIINNALNPKFVDPMIFQSPIVIGLMIANRCNLSCKYCISANGNGYSSSNVFAQNFSLTLDRLNKSQVISLVISGGEPTLCTALPSILRRMSKCDFLCLLDTNGIILSRELLDTLQCTDVIPRISLDSIYEHEHNVNRGNYKKTVSNIFLMLEKNIPLRLNTVLNRTNLNSLFKLAEWMLGNGIKKWHIFKLQKTFAPPNLWISDEEAKSTLEALVENYGDKIDILYKFSSNNDGFSSFIVDSEGGCFSTEKQKVNFGNIYTKELSPIWLNTQLDYRLRHYIKYLAFKGKTT